MATYAIGDVQGCEEPLVRLLEHIAFDGRRDRLWFVGDLVNRGPDSLGVLRRVRALGDAAVVVLGNHDVHLLARAYGVGRVGRRDTLDAVLAAPDRDDLVEWLRARPLVHREGGYLLVHAGLLPAWSGADAERLAREAEAALRDETRTTQVLDAYYHAASWDESLAGAARAGAVLAVLTRLRTCTPAGEVCDEFSGPPAAAPSGYVPWFAVPGRRSAGETVIFGHWAALGLHVTCDLCALDTGCVWGNALTALRLEDRAVFQVRAVR
jgi:bis(5'-nucleosyl)-tetraphosphatase (symmetrical)